MGDAEHDGIPCLLMRGGTSKGAYFLAADLPVEPAARDELLLRVMGSPDPRQIDGLGGAHPLTSKVAILSPSTAPGIDVDYLFLQVSVDEPIVSEAQTCGNLLAGVGPCAVERGLVPAGEGETAVRIRLMNTGATATATFPTSGGRVVYAGEQRIDGVPGSAAPVSIEFGSAEPRAVLPTGRAAETLPDADGRPRRVTLVDAGMPVVLLDAAEFGVAGDETPAALEADAELVRQVEAIRLAAGPAMGLGDVAGQTVPKVFLLSEPRRGGAISTRAFIPHRVHEAIGVLMAASVAAGVRVAGAVGSAFAAIDDESRLEIEHPSGSFAALLRLEDRPGIGPVLVSATDLRTARKIFDGRVFPRPRPVALPA